MKRRAKSLGNDTLYTCEKVQGEISRVFWCPSGNGRTTNSWRAALAVIIIRPRQGGSGFKYTIPTSDLPKLGAMNAKLDPRDRWDAVMKDDSLFSVEAAP